MEIDILKVLIDALFTRTSIISEKVIRFNLTLVPTHYSEIKLPYLVDSRYT